MSQQSARIVREVHDEPHIEGSRITVRHVYERVHERGLRPETVADRHDLDLADVYHALAYYYYDHPAEMREVEGRRRPATRPVLSRERRPHRDVRRRLRDRVRRSDYWGVLFFTDNGWPSTQVADRVHRILELYPPSELRGMNVVDRE